ARTGAKPPLAYSPFLAQRVKDAIVDRMRARARVRPTVDREAPDVLAYVHVTESGRAMVGLDFSGRSLHERGYRTQAGPAPLRETLAGRVVPASAGGGAARRALRLRARWERRAAPARSAVRRGHLPHRGGAPRADDLARPAAPLVRLR